MIRYSDFSHLINIDAFEEAIGYEVLYKRSNKYGEPEDIGHCPDPWSLHKHGDTTGKFAINRERRIYNCWVCGGGSLLSLAMAVNNLSEQAANEWLFQFSSSEQRSHEDFLSEIDAILYKQKIENPPLPYFNEHVLERWVDNLPRAAGWLADRGISHEVAHQHKIGFDPEAERLLPAKKQSYVGPSVFFPHFWGGKLVGWQQRWLGEDRPKWLKKYTNTNDFPREQTIFNYERVYLSDRPIIVCESVPTVLFLASLGYPAVGTFGGSITSEQLRLLRQCQQGLVLAPDNDEPGYKWFGYTEAERRAMGRGERVNRTIPADYLARYVSVKVIQPIGEYNSGDDLGDIEGHTSDYYHEIKSMYENAFPHLPT